MFLISCFVSVILHDFLKYILFSLKLCKRPYFLLHIDDLHSLHFCFSSHHTSSFGRQKHWQIVVLTEYIFLKYIFSKYIFPKCFFSKCIFSKYIFSKYIFLKQLTRQIRTDGYKFRNRQSKEQTDKNKYTDKETDELLYIFWFLSQMLFLSLVWIDSKQIIVTKLAREAS